MLHLLDKHKKKSSRNSGMIKASYDAAATTSHNERHWSYADSLSPDESARPEVREKLRNRARYEVLRNSSIGGGMVRMFANDTVGTSIQLVMGLENEADNREVQKVVGYWMDAIDAVEKIRTGKIDKTVSGETLFRIVTNPSLDHEVMIDLLPMEADHLSAPVIHDYFNPQYVDGVHLDRLKNPTAYDILREHPGSVFGGVNWQYDTFSRDSVIHWFRRDRPGQHRGVSEVAAALPLFAHRRRFTLATIAAAETAANRATVLKTDLEPGNSLTEEVDAWATENMLSSITLDRNASTVLPIGWDLSQQSAEHPTTTFAMFDKAIVMELSRCLLMPYETVSGDHSGLSFSGGRLSRAGYERAVEVERADIKKKILDVLLSEFLYEAAVEGILPNSVSRMVLDIASRVSVRAIAKRMPHSWHFDGFKEPDEVKAANAAKVRLQSGLTSRESELAKQGVDIDEIDASAARSFGVSVDEYRRACFSSIMTNGNAVVAGSPTDVISRLDEIDTAKEEQLVGVE
ncbi:MAG: phage portal protein [Planctomycetota bacterium]